MSDKAHHRSSRSPLPCSLGKRARHFRKGEKGYMLAVLAVFTSVLLVTLSEAAINWQRAIQREREEELIFRGKQFMRAIELWQRKFPNTYPTTIDALLSTNNTRFLRKKWKDPITNTDDWRLIKLNADGSISGATVTPGTSPLGPSTLGTPSASASGRRQTTGTTASPASRQQPTSRQSGSGQSAFSPILGGIVGIASKSEKEALKAYNGRTKYSEWDFVYVPRGPIPNQAQGAQAQPGAQQQPQGAQTPARNPAGQPAPAAAQPGR
jgi:type II secretory pathway pseudopilin PulG